MGRVVGAWEGPRGGDLEEGKFIKNSSRLSQHADGQRPGGFWYYFQKVALIHDKIYTTLYDKTYYFLSESAFWDINSECISGAKVF